MEKTSKDGRQNKGQNDKDGEWNKGMEEERTATGCSIDEEREEKQEEQEKKMTEGCRQKDWDMDTYRGGPRDTHIRRVERKREGRGARQCDRARRRECSPRI